MASWRYGFAIGLLWLVFTEYSFASCLHFADEAALQARKAYWLKEIQQLSSQQQMAWLIGVGKPLSAAAKESEQQRDCLLTAARQAVSTTVRLPAQLTYSGYRDFNHQKTIWTRKYLFQGNAFNRISPQAHQACPDLLQADESLWQPGNARHRQCWSNHLTPDQRQMEILQASSAPGTSRHHWGSDFDLFDPNMNPDHWQVGKPLFTVYQWMQANARQYGLFQPYKAVSYPGSRAYIEERWHWSYYPVAQALLTVLKQQPEAVEQALVQHWGEPSRFSYIKKYWRDFVLNVDEK